MHKETFYVEVRFSEDEEPRWVKSPRVYKTIAGAQRAADAIEARNAYNGAACEARVCDSEGRIP